MRREYPEAPMVGVGAIIIKDNRVVLVKRAKPPLAGEWSIPGGMLEIGETVREGTVREAKEETGLEVETGDLLGVFDRIVRDAESHVQYHYVLIDFLCRPIVGELCAGGDASEVQWFAPEEISTVSLMKDTAAVIELGFMRKK